jgi:hypothetical protein
MATREVNLQGPSDHISVSVGLDMGDTPDIIRRSLAKGSEEEVSFLSDIIDGLQTLQWEEPRTPDDVSAMAAEMADIFTKAWERHSKISRLTHQSKPWWTQECSDALQNYREDRSQDNWGEFRRAVKASKRKFFDSRINKIAVSNKQPWDLMEWVQQRKLPPVEAIQYNGQPCHDLEDLWRGLHGTYNSASGREVDLSVLDPLEPLPE